MKLAEIERDLRSADPRVRYHVARMQEEMTVLEKRVSQCAELLVKVVDALNQLRIVNMKLNSRWEKRLRGEPDIDMVESVLTKPED
jgi:hypothetical protein